MEVAGVPRCSADGGVAAGDGPAPFQSQCVDLWKAVIPGVVIGQIESGFGAVAVALEKHDVVAAGAEAVDEHSAVTASAVRCVHYSRAEEAPEAVTNSHLVIHQPSIIRASRPLWIRQSMAMSG